MHWRDDMKRTKLFAPLALITALAAAFVAGCSDTGKEKQEQPLAAGGPASAAPSVSPSSSPIASPATKPETSASPSASPAPSAAPTTPPSIAPASSPKPKEKPAPAASAASKPAAKPSSEASNKAYSWYYMKKQKGEVPRFPNETKQLKPEQKMVWVGTGKKVYLTFDTGGPLGESDKLLQILQDNDVKATFFLVGYNVKEHRDFTKKVADAGHTIGNHTMTHKDMTELSDETVKKELNDFAALIQEVTGKPVAPLFRFPYGKYSMHLLDLVSDMGYTSAFWSTAMRDWEPRKGGAEEPYNDIMNNLHDGNVILMHQGSKENIEALDKIIKAIKQEGYEFASLTELAVR